MSGSSMPACGNKTKKIFKIQWNMEEMGSGEQEECYAGLMTRRLQNFWTFGKGTESVLFFKHNNTHVYFAFRFTHPA